MARPTKYNQEIVNKARDYIHDFATHDHVMPSVVGMAVVLDISKSTLYKWAEEHDEFSDIIEQCNSSQEFELTNKGLKGSINPTITKLILGKHGYSDKQEVEQNTDMTIEIVQFTDAPDR